MLAQRLQSLYGKVMKSNRPKLFPTHELWHAYRELWREVTGESLSYERALKYGPGLLALVGAIARWKRTLR
jgi:hypothetical protein